MSHAPFFLAIEKGYFRELGLEVEATEFRGTDVAMPFLANGQLDVVGGAVAAGFLNALHQGVSGRIVAMISGAGPDGFLPSALVVSKENFEAGRFTSPAHLQGRRLAVTGKGSYGEFVADRALRKAGLTINDVELVILGFPDMLPGLASGAIDAASLTEPWVLYAQERGIGAIIVREGLDPNSTAQVVLYGEQFIRHNPEGARRFMVGYLRALRDLARSRYQDPVEAAIVEQYTKVPADVIMRAVSAQVDVDGRMNIDHLMLQQQFYLERGYLNYREPLDLRRFVDYTWLDHAIQQLGPYRP
jgi:NitT/TauT family transport system substrate-binding protein